MDITLVSGLCQLVFPAKTSRVKLGITIQVVTFVRPAKM